MSAIDALTCQPPWRIWGAYRISRNFEWLAATICAALVEFTTNNNAMRSWGDILRTVFIFAVLVVLGPTGWDEVPLRQARQRGIVQIDVPDEPGKLMLKTSRDEVENLRNWIILHSVLAAHQGWIADTWRHCLNVLVSNRSFRGELCHVWLSNDRSGVGRMGRDELFPLVF